MAAEKASTLHTEEYFRQRARRADRSETLRILERAGKGNAPMPGDELPAGWKKDHPARKTARKEQGTGLKQESHPSR